MKNKRLGTMLNVRLGQVNRMSHGMCHGLPQHVNGVY